MRPETLILKYAARIVLSMILILATNIKAHSQEEEEEEMKDARISLTFEEDMESSKTITAHVTDLEGNPVEELDLFFFVKRTFSLLPIGDAFNTTDEEGKVTVVFPEDLPSDQKGNVTIVVKIMESDVYNDLAVEQVKNWGIKPDYDLTEEERSLWATSANAPWSLVLSTSLLILASWYIYWHIIYVLYKISKIKPEETTK